MNWSASVAQLLATGVMILLKAYVRRNLSAVPETTELTEGYELDLMAKKINRCHAWRIVSTSNPSQLPRSNFPTDLQLNVAAYAHEVLTSRVRLSELTKWPSQFSETVDELVNTLQSIMHWTFDKSRGKLSLKKPYEDICEFTWKIPVLVDSEFVSGRSELRITMRRTKVDNNWTSWTFDKEEVSAMFSLWMSDFTESSPLVSQPNLWIVGPNSQFNRIIHDWWIYRGTPSDQINTNDISGFCRQKRIDARRIFNLQTSHTIKVPILESQIGVVVQASLQRINAQYLLGSFLGDLLRCVEKLDGDTGVMEGPGAGGVTLFDGTIRSLAEVLQRSSSISVEDSYRILIPILNELDMLQDPFDTLEDIVTISKSQSKSRNAIRETCERLTYLCERKARILTDQDRFREAGGLFLRLIDVFNRILGSEDESVANARQAMTEFAAGFVGFPIDKLAELSKRPKVVEPFRLHAAAARGDIRLVFQTLLHGVGANTWNDEHEIPVGLAIQFEYIDIARLILFYGGPIDKDLLYAVINKHNAGEYTNGPEIIKFLLLNLADKSDLLLEASAKGYHMVLDWMAQTGTDINQMDSNGYTPLHLAAENGNHEVITILLNHNADPNIKATPTDEIALHLAVKQGRYKIALALIDAGSDLLARDKRGMTPLHVAAHQGKLDLVRLLVDRGSDINGKQKKRQTALHLAAIANHPAIVEELLSHHELDQHVQDDDQRTALHLAAAKPHYKEVVELLSRDQANLLVRDKYGRDALITATDMNTHDVDEEIIKMLIQRGSDLSAVEDSGRGSLEFAAINGHINVIKMLLAGGAPLTNRDGFGRVALHYAAMGGSDTAARLLLDNGVAVDAVDKDQWTALHYASRPGHTKVMEVLKAAGADANSVDRLGNTADYYFKDGKDSNYWTRMLPVTPFWSGS
ncbi:Ankyrin-2 [Arthrobotrys entomopaga]|nr:Ankyrin-2 [Arthrobotrys entomopaga]